MFSVGREGKPSCDVTGESPHYHINYTLSKCRVDEIIQAFSPENAQKSIEG